MVHKFHVGPITSDALKTVAVPRGEKEKERKVKHKHRDWSFETGRLCSGTSNATLKSTMDTLVLRCQHTWTVVLPRWGVCRSRDVREALRSSSDSWSALDSSGDSGKYGKSSHLTRKEWKFVISIGYMFINHIFPPGTAESHGNIRGI